MIKSFADIETERLCTTGKSKRFPPDILKRAIKRLTQLDAAMVIDDLRMPPSNHLEALSGKRTGQWSLRIMINGAFVFDLKTERLTMLKLLIITKEIKL